jgi:isochorismate pyruvate lyase
MRGLFMKRLLFLPGALFAASLGPAGAQTGSASTQAFWGAPSIDGGKCCATLGKVRDNIDRLDREIIRLMAERGKYVAEAGRFKANTAAVSAPARVEAIIAKVKTVARQDGLPESVAERSYRAMIAAFEDYERDEWIKRNAGASPGQK